MNTEDAIKAIRKALRRRCRAATLLTRVGHMPTTKGALSDLLPSLGEVTRNVATTSGVHYTFSTDDHDATVDVYPDSVCVGVS